VSLLTPRHQHLEQNTKHYCLARIKRLNVAVTHGLSFLQRTTVYTGRRASSNVLTVSLKYATLRSMLLNEYKMCQSWLASAWAKRFLPLLLLLRIAVLIRRQPQQPSLYLQTLQLHSDRMRHWIRVSLGNICENFVQCTISVSGTSDHLLHWIISDGLVWKRNKVT
jgi:hypothetical protein